MPHVADRVKDSGTVTGTGAVTLSGTPTTGFRAFASSFNVGDYIWYCIDDGVGNWEVGYGALTGATTLSRDSISSSSNSNNIVTFGASTTVTVFCDAAADLIEDSAYSRSTASRMNLLMQ